jgi:hypothetical protein
MDKKINATEEAKAQTGMTVDAKVRRGAESWNYLYITLGLQSQSRAQ